MYQTFVDLLLVALGKQDTLSHTPSKEEWMEIYEMAQEQTLLGICFNALQRMGGNSEDGWKKLGIPEMLYLKWMAKVAIIRKRNELVTRQCIDLQGRLSQVGVCSWILKGQGVAQLYDESLLNLRQPGDIDIYVKGGYEKATSVAKKIAPIEDARYVHAIWEVYEDTEVELHYRPSSLRNLIRNHRFQRWARSFGDDSFEMHGGMMVPPPSFNRIYLLQHCYRHVIGAGIGLRQLMDYYFCLKSSPITEEERKQTITILKKLGLFRFAGAVMYVLEKVFALDRSLMICDPNTREGEYLLKQTMLGGNFGRYDQRVKREGSGLLRKLFMNSRYALHYPEELLWALPFSIYKNLWKWRHKEAM